MKHPETLVPYGEGVRNRSRSGQDGNPWKVSNRRKAGSGEAFFWPAVGIAMRGLRDHEEPLRLDQGSRQRSRGLRWAEPPRHDSGVLTPVTGIAPKIFDVCREDGHPVSPAEGSDPQREGIHPRRSAVDQGQPEVGPRLSDDQPRHACPGTDIEDWPNHAFQGDDELSGVLDDL